MVTVVYLISYEKCKENFLSLIHFPKYNFVIKKANHLFANPPKPLKIQAFPLVDLMIIIGKLLLTQWFEPPVFTGLLKDTLMLGNIFITALLSYLYKAYICLSVQEDFNNRNSNASLRQFCSVYKGFKATWNPFFFAIVQNFGLKTPFRFSLKRSILAQTKNSNP